MEDGPKYWRDNSDPEQREQQEFRGDLLVRGGRPGLRAAFGPAQRHNQSNPLRRSRTTVVGLESRVRASADVTCGRWKNLARQRLPLGEGEGFRYHVRSQ